MMVDLCSTWLGSLERGRRVPPGVCVKSGLSLGRKKGDFGGALEAVIGSVAVILKLNIGIERSLTQWLSSLDGKSMEGSFELLIVVRRRTTSQSGDTTK
jgi:hypothetical protein